jgi:hypothetical protein
VVLQDFVMVVALWSYPVQPDKSASAALVFQQMPQMQRELSGILVASAVE